MHFCVTTVAHWRQIVSQNLVFIGLSIAVMTKRHYTMTSSNAYISLFVLWPKCTRITMIKGAKNSNISTWKINRRIRFGLQTIFVCLYITSSHYHHCANFIWRHWTCKMPVRYELSSVWITLSLYSQLSIIQCVGLCVFSLSIPFVIIERIYILCLLIIIKSEVWTITHCLGLCHETMVCAVCLSIFL